MPLSIRFYAKLRINGEGLHFHSYSVYIFEADEELELLSFVPKDRKYELIAHALRYGYLDEANTAFWQAHPLSPTLDYEGVTRLRDFTRRQLKLEIIPPSTFQSGADFSLTMAMHDNPQRVVTYAGQLLDVFEIVKTPLSDLASR